MPIISRNPSNLDILATYPELSRDEIDVCLKNASQAYQKWQLTSFKTRQKYMLQLAQEIRANREDLARLITLEMGCPLDQAMSEIDKCAAITEQYAHEAESFLKAESQEIEAQEAYVCFEPLGTVLHVAPWNYPFYLALRPVIPALMAGNTVVLKSASNVPQCGLMIQRLFSNAGFPPGVFQTLLVSSSEIEAIIARPEIAMVSVIASETAGSQIAMQAGKLIKKTVLELGGSDPFIVLKDADLDKAVSAAVNSRLRNCGQSCNAAKRFIVVKEIADHFTMRLKHAFEKQKLGNPLEAGVDIGPLATRAALLELQNQVDESMRMGAQLITGGKRPETLSGYYYEPTILTNVTRHMPVFTQEVFGPVAPIMTVDDVDSAIGAANDTDLGLGASVWTQDYDLARTLIPRIQAGNVYLNAMVRGNPKLPYGGIKKSGYGREFGAYGIKEFVNIKTVVINQG